MKINGKSVSAKHFAFDGCFGTAEDAYSAYLKAKSELHLFNPVPRNS